MSIELAKHRDALRLLRQRSRELVAVFHEPCAACVDAGALCEDHAAQVSESVSALEYALYEVEKRVPEGAP